MVNLTIHKILGTFQLFSSVEYLCFIHNLTIQKKKIYEKNGYKIRDANKIIIKHLI